MVIIRDRPLAFLGGGGVGLGNCLGHDIFFSPLGCALFFFWWAKGYAPLAHFFQRFLLSRILGGVIAQLPPSPFKILMVHSLLP